MEFKAFPKIERIGKLFMRITQKIHGSNAQIVISPASTYEENGWTCWPKDAVQVGDKYFQVKVGSRNRWIAVGDDNYGFAAFVEANKREIVEKLGEGTHFGEWAGPGINSGEGLTEKTFILFDHWKFPPERPLPPQTKVVPLLYQGSMDLQAIDNVMTDLKTNGSKLVSGFMRPEGVVIEFGGVRYKKVFEVEETQWTNPSGVKSHVPCDLDLSHLLQPIRLEKLISRDERYIKEYPATLGTLAQDYVKDLEDEGQITGDPEVIKGIKKQLGRQLYPFLKDIIKERHGI